MASLEERLKRIRQSAAPNIITRSNDTTASTTGSSARINKDEVEDLLQQTSNLVDLERKHSGSHSTDPNIEAWLNDDDYDVDVDDDDGEEEEVAEGGTERTSDGTEMPNTIGQDTVQEIQEESDNLTLRAEEALRDLHSKGVFKEANALLQVEPKTKPVLSRSSSDQNQFNDVPTSISLEDDLADAMGDELGTQKVENQSNEEETTSKEVDDLMKRLALLRSGAGAGAGASAERKDKVREQEKERKENSDFLFDLPSAPSTMPTALEKDGADDVDWKGKHGVEGRDLSSYEALVRLNATKLGAPSKETKKKTDRQVEEGNEVDDWCCICNEDAILSCLGCDFDLYCRKCWNEGHLDMEKEERDEHRTKLFAGRKKPAMAV